jgi:outer membrane protein insertion porin family
MSSANPRQWPLAAVLVLCLTSLVTSARAQALTEPASSELIVMEVRYTGNAPVTPAQLPTVVTELPDSPYSEYKVRTAVERLYDTGRYAQVRIFRHDVPGGVALEIELTAKLRVGQVLFEGADAVSGRELRRRVQTQEDGEFAENIVGRDRLGLVALYKEHGYFDATVRALFTTEGPVRDVTFVIDEGGQALVRAVTMDGAKAIPAEDLRRRLPIHTGDPYSARALSRGLDDLRELYAERGYLSMESSTPKVSHDSGDNTVDIAIPIFEGARVRVEFSGNVEYDDESLTRVAGLERVNDFALEAARDNLIDFLARRGHLNATVDSPTQTTRDEDVVVAFHVVEGPRYHIDEVRFRAVEALTSAELYEQVRTRERGGLRWIPLVGLLANAGRYDPDVFLEDRRVLELHYHRLGYRQADVRGGPVIEADGERLAVVFDIIEGPRSMVSAVEIRGNDTLGSEALLSRVRLKPGDPRDRLRELAGERSIRELYAARGRPYTEVRTAFNKETGLLTYEVVEGPPVTIGRILIQFENANPKTRPYVVRRELLIDEGDAYSGLLLDRSRRRLFRLGFFSRISIRTPGFDEGEETVDVNIVLRERSAGSLNVRGGFSPSEGVRGTFEVLQRNWNGTGRRLGGQVRFGTLGNRYELTFVEPWTFSTPTRTTFRAFRDNLEEQDDTLTTGALINLSQSIYTHNRVSLQYRYQEFSVGGGIKDVKIEDLGIQPTLSAVGAAFLRDTRDNLFAPSRGWYNEVRLEVAGGAVGAKTRFTRLTTDSRYYRRPVGDIVFASQLRLGVSSRRADLSPISSTERFRLGGSTSVRGYPERSLGKPDLFGHFRGDLLFQGNAELRIPIKGIVGMAYFLDVGNLWTGYDDIFDDLPKVAIGGGLRVQTPIGPARLDVGLPLSRLRDLDQDPRLWVALGNAF